MVFFCTVGTLLTGWTADRPLVERGALLGRRLLVVHFVQGAVVVVERAARGRPGRRE